MLAGLKANLRGVTDAVSAKAALPQLEKEGAEFDKLRNLAGKLSVDAKAAFAALTARLVLPSKSCSTRFLRSPA